MLHRRMVGSQRALCVFASLSSLVLNQGLSAKEELITCETLDLDDLRAVFNPFVITSVSSLGQDNYENSRWANWRALDTCSDCQDKVPT